MKQISLLLCNLLLPRLSLDLGILFLMSGDACSGGNWGRGVGDPRAQNLLPRLMPASCLRATQRTAYLAADLVASFNHDLPSWNGARFNNSLHDGWRGEEIKKEKGRKTGIRWSNFTSAPGGFRRLHSPRGASRSGSIFPGPADPTPPPAQPLRPGAAVFKLAPSGREWRGGLGAGANGGAEGCAFGQGRGRETGWREEGKG